MSDKRLLVGEIGAPHGVRGQLRVKSHTADPLAIADYGPLVTADGRAFVIKAIRLDKTVVIVTLDGVNDRNGAEALKGERLYVDRDALPDAGEDDFYHADLIGLTAVTRDGETLGRITAVHDFGAGDLLDVARETGASVLVPFTRDVVPQVNIAAGHVVVDPPEGLLDAPRQDKPKRRRSPRARARAEKPRSGKSDPDSPDSDKPKTGAS